MLVLRQPVLGSSIAVWFGSDRNRLQRIIGSAEWIIGSSRPSILGLKSSRVSKRAEKVTEDPSRTGHNLLHSSPKPQEHLLPSGRLPDEELISHTAPPFALYLNVAVYVVYV